MSTLPYDISRCTGRIPVHDDGPDLCLERKTCKRYLAFDRMFEEQVTVPSQVSINCGRADCDIKIEVSE